MGVKGLWRLIAPVGKPISLESLEGKVLAVDVSIWLNKAAKGMRDKHGNAIYNAHLVLMFNRICKLLFYGIKPVFVFDGGVPELKKKTLKMRRERRTRAESSKNKTKELILKNYLQTKALEAVSGAKSSSKLNLVEKKEKEDIFLLPPMPANDASQSDSSSDDDVINEDEWLQTLNEHGVQEMFDNVDSVDIESEEFLALPAEVKHELLTEIKQSYRRRYKKKNEEQVALPEVANEFSSFQLKNLMKRGHITQHIDSLRKEMNNSMTAQFISLYGEDFDKNKYQNQRVEGKRYASNARQSYILVKNVAKKEENKLFKTNLDEDYNRFKEKNHANAHLFKKMEREPARFQTLLEQNVAARKRLASESSEEMELQSGVRGAMNEAPCSSKSTTTPNVEFMSDSSSEQSDFEQNNKVENTESDVANRLELLNDDKTNVLDQNGRETLIRENPTLDDTDHLPLVRGDDKTDESRNVETILSDDSNISTMEVVKQEKKEETVLPVIESKLKSKHEIIDNEQNVIGIKCLTHENDLNRLKPSKEQLSSLSCDVTSPLAETLHDKGLETLQLSKEQSSVSPQILSPTSSSSYDVTSPLTDDHNDIGPDTLQLSEDQPIIVSPTPSILPDVTPTITKTGKLFDQNPTADVAVDDVAEEIRIKIAGKEITPKSGEDAARLQNILAEEQRKLEEDSRKQSRQAATLSNETYQDVQELLRIFGIPYLVSPAEAEAQCAQLDYSKLTDGSITDDSDIFLFGASRVYKNMFNQKKFAELYSADDLIKKLYLTRDKLIALAFLTGSDYTEGVQGVGGITGMEVLQEFARSKPKETLKVFKNWVLGRVKDFNPGSNLKSKLRNAEVTNSFNSTAVWQAYLSPVVETSDEPFEWSNPDIDAIKEFASEKFGWLYSRTDETLKPVMQVLSSKRKRQKTLKAYFQPSFITNQEANVTSKRLQKVLNKVANDTTGGCGAGSSQVKGDDPDSLFQDTSFDDDDLLEMTEEPCSSTSTSSFSNVKQQLKRAPAMASTSHPSPSKCTKVSHRLDNNKFSANVSTNKHVQAQKVSNLIRAAEQSLKPQTPFVAMQHVNNMVRNKLAKGKRTSLMNNRGGRGGKARRQKVTSSLLEAANAAQCSSVRSSSSDSD